MIRYIRRALSLRRISCGLGAILLALGGLNSGAEAKSYRIAYFEAGDYPYHRELQREFREKLEELAPAGMEIVYPPNGYKSAEWKRDECKRLAREITADRSFDLIVAMGPWTVEDLLAANCKKPIVALGRFDPVLEGLADKTGRPVKNNLTVRIRPGKVETDLAALKAVYSDAERLGLLYFPSANESAIVERFVTEKARSVGMELLAIPPDAGDPNYKFFKKIEELRGRVDAVYLTPLYGLSLEQISSMIEALNNAGIAVFSSEGLYMVDRGAFASNAAYTTAGAGLFSADKVIRILQGATPRELPTAFREGRRLSINLGACERHNIKPAAHFLAEARVIEPPLNPDAPMYTIKGAISEGLRTNPGALADKEALEVAEKRAAEFRSVFFPQLRVDAYVRDYDEDPPLNALRRFTQGSSGYDLTLSQNVFDWERFKQSSAESKRAEMLTHKFEHAQSEFEFAIAETYLTLALALERKAALDTHRELLQRILQVALARYMIEQGERLDVVRWESRKDRATTELVSANEEVSKLRAALLSLLGRPFPEEFAIDRGIYPFADFKWTGSGTRYFGADSRETAEEFWVAEALVNQPALQRSSAELATARVEYGAAGSWYLPKITAEAGYFSDDQFAVQAPLTVDEDGWYFGARASIALFDGARGMKKRARLKARINELEYRQDEATLEVATAVRKAFRSLVGAYDRTLFSARVQRFASDALDETRTGYEMGRVSFAEMENEAQNSLRAELGFLQATYDYYLAQFNLWRTVGYGYLEPNSGRQNEILGRLQEYLTSAPEGK